MKPKKRKEKKHKKFNSKKTIQLFLKYPEKAQLKVLEAPSGLWRNYHHDLSETS